MSLVTIGFNATPSYIALSTDISDDTIDGISYIGKLVYTTDDKAWYIINEDLTLSVFSFGGDADVSAIKTDTEEIIADVGVVQTTADGILEEAVKIETHLHSVGSWFGKAITPDTTVHVADRIGPGVLPFEIDAGNNTWGDWVQVLGSDDTPARTGQLFFDPHQMLIQEAQEEVVYFIQFARGASGEAGYTAGTYTELVVGVDATKKFKSITDVQTGRAPAGSLLWARCLAYGANTGTLAFYIGIHEYPE